MELRIKIPMVTKTLDPKGTRIISQVEKTRTVETMEGMVVSPMIWHLF